MWLMTPDGMYSVVKPEVTDPFFQAHGQEGDLVVRARSKDDLEALRHWLPEMRAIVPTEFRDYGFRVFVAADHVAWAVARMVLDIDYTNFKDQVKITQGSERAGVYGRVWGDLLEIQEPGWRNSLALRYSTFGHVDDELPGNWDGSDIEDEDVWMDMVEEDHPVIKLAPAPRWFHWHPLRSLRSWLRHRALVSTLSKGL
jgi:hypothetical protein